MTDERYCESELDRKGSLRNRRFGGNRALHWRRLLFSAGRLLAGGGDAPNKNAFLTGFGLGFLAFGLQKLMLPFMIGAQIVKSVLIAMFLPSIIGGIGKLVGKGVSGFATASNGFGQPYGQSYGQANSMMHGQMEDFEFKVCRAAYARKPSFSAVTASLAGPGQLRESAVSGHAVGGLLLRVLVHLPQWPGLFQTAAVRGSTAGACAESR